MTSGTGSDRGRLDSLRLIERWRLALTIPAGGMVAAAIGLAALIAHEILTVRHPTVIAILGTLLLVWCGVAWMLHRRFRMMRADLLTLARDADRQIEEANRRLTNLTATIDDARAFAWATDPSRRLTTLGAGFARLTGLSAESAIGQRFDELDAFTDTGALLNALRAGRPFEAVTVPMKSTAGEVLMVLSGQPIEDAGWRGLAFDMTASLIATDSARARANLLGAALESVSEAIARFDAEERLLYANAACAAFYGERDPNHLIGRTAEDIFKCQREQRRIRPDTPDLAEELAERMRRFRARGDHELQSADGRWFLARDRATADGGTVTLYTDITALKREQAHVGLIRHRVVDALDALTQGIALFDADDRLVIGNRVFRHFFPRLARTAMEGMPFRDFAEMAVALGDIDTGDTPHAEYVRKRLNAHYSETGKPFRLRLRDGRWVRVIERATGDGARVLLYDDVTALAEAEAERRGHESRFTSLINGLRDIIFYRGHPDGTTYAYGADALDITGTLDHGHVADREKWYAMIHPDDRAAYLAAECERREHGQRFHIDFRFRRPDSATYQRAREVGWVVDDDETGQRYFDGYIVLIDDDNAQSTALRRH